MKVFQLRFVVLGILLSAFLQTPALAQGTPAFDQQKLDTYLNTLLEKNKMMGTIAIDSAGREVYNRSLGYLQFQNKIPADRSTRYRIGSVTKIFTAAMVFQLIEEKELSLSTRLKRFYPGIPQAGSITVEHLLRHQSGLFNFTNGDDYTSWMTEGRTKKEMLELFRNQQPQFSPGEQTSYSNTNYVLLGYIIEDITGDTYSGQLKKRITGPLNLKHTYYGDGIDTENGEALSYRYRQSQWGKMPETDMSIPGGAGAIVSTTDDLTDFIRALFRGRLISDQSLSNMTDMEQGLGMGLMKMPFNNTYAYGHNGSIDGFQAHVSYFPEKDIALALTSNALNYSMNNILVGTLSIYLGRPFEIPSFDHKTVQLNTSQLQKYVGQYTTKQLPMDISIFIEDSTLKAQGSGQPSFPLAANSDTTFRFDQAGVVIQFDSLSGGKYHQFMLKQAGGKFLFRRK